MVGIVYTWLNAFMQRQVIPVFPQRRHVSPRARPVCAPFPPRRAVPDAMFMQLNAPCWNRDGHLTEGRHPIGCPLANQIPSSGNLGLDRSERSCPYGGERFWTWRRPGFTEKTETDLLREAEIKKKKKNHKAPEKEGHKAQPSSCPGL